MKKVAILFIVLLTSSFVFAQNTYVPDDKFEQALIDLGYDTTMDDSVLTANISGVTSLDVQNKEIADLTGIEDFVALIELDVRSNFLTSLDVNANTALTILMCFSNQLTSLDVSKNTALTLLWCHDNQLTSLDVSKNTVLNRLNFSENKITSIDVTNNTALNELYCWKNQLTNLDVSKNITLKELNIYSNQLTSLDVSSNTALTYLHSSENQLTSLDVSKNTALNELQCWKNQLTSLDVSKNTALDYLSLYKNQLTSLDLSQNTKLKVLYVSENKLTSLNMRNGIKDALITFFAQENPGLTCIEVLDPVWATANWTNADVTKMEMDAGVTFSVICGGTDLTTWHVDTTGSDGSGSGTLASPLATIQTGINATSANDTVSVSAGTYTENINFNGKNISVVGDNRETTIIDGNQSGSVVTFNSGEDSTAVLSRFTIQNGNADLPMNANGDGGGIYCLSSSPSLKNMKIIDNSATWGGGVYCGDNSSPNLENMIITGNSASAHGGGIYCFYNSSPTLTDVTITNNSASEDGGGIKCENNSNPSLQNVTISGNTAEKRGGGINVQNSTVTFKNTIIANNTATVRGGGIYNHDSNVTLTNVTITNNKATNDTGGGIYTTGSTLSVNNSIIWNNFQDEINGDATVTYSNIKGGYTGTGNIDADPLFCDTLSYKYYATSPAVGAGENGVNMGAGGIGCDVPQAFEWVSTALDTINITKTNLTDTYTAQWTESKDVYNDSINYLVYAKVGVYPAEEIYDTTVTSVSITYQEILWGVFEGSPVNGATVSLNVKATDGIDTVDVTGDNRVIYVNRYEYLSTEGEGVPVEFALHENYPNPFNPTTTLRFDLPEVSDITLTIYNMLGQKVRTFNYQNTSAGYHSVKWNATNDYGDPVGAGVYLYQLQTKDFVKTRKMVLLK